MTRLFTAIEFPREINEQLTGMCTGIEQAKWIEPQQIHLTLKFYGDVDDAQAISLQKELENVQLPGFELSIRGVGSFTGKDQRTIILWAGVEPSPELQTLQLAVTNAANSAGIQTREEVFNAHITLARLNRYRVAELENWQNAHKDFQARTVRIDRFTLLASELTSAGAAYTKQNSFPLAQPKTTTGNKD